MGNSIIPSLSIVESLMEDEEAFSKMSAVRLSSENALTFSRLSQSSQTTLDGLGVNLNRLDAI